jgi:predicted metal-dependent HD superfamily phosphohydrolase
MSRLPLQFEPVTPANDRRLDLLKHLGRDVPANARSHLLTAYEENTRTVHKQALAASDVVAAKINALRTSDPAVLRSALRTLTPQGNRI